MSKVTNLPASFVGISGRFYVRQRRADGSGLHHRLTVWPTVEDYNNLTPAPLEFCDTADALADFNYEVTICPQSLKTMWLADRNETDAGLTLARNLWADRFKRAKKDRRHAA